MRNLWIASWLCLLALKPLTCSSITITEVYPGQAAEEIRAVVFGQPVYRPAGTTFDLAASASTHRWWFEPRLRGIATTFETNIPPITITNYADIITYTATIKPIAFQLGYDIVESNRIESVQYASREGYVDIDAQTGHAVSTGTGRDVIELVSESLTRELVLDASVTPPGIGGQTEFVELHEYLHGSLKNHINTNFAAIVEGHDGSESNLAIYSLQDHAATNYVRNTNCWAYALDLTCASPWNSTGDGALASKTGLPSGQFRAATAITPRHLLSSNHYHLMQTWEGVNTNRKVRFITQHNQVIERTVVAYSEVTSSDLSITNYVTQRTINDYGGATNLGSDYVVMRLNDELPESITPAKRLPSDWLDHMPYTQGMEHSYSKNRYHENYPIVMTDQEERATIGESRSMGLGSCATYNPNFNGLYGSYFLFDPYYRKFALFERRDTYTAYYRNKIKGDSSSPMLLFIDDVPVITGTLTFGGGGAASIPLAFYYDAIQSIITDEFGDTNIWEAADLSGYATFERID